MLNANHLVDEPFEVVGRSGTQGQGPFIYLTLQGTGQTVAKAWFETHGCPSSIRCGDWLCKWAVGRSLETLQVIEAEDLQRVVGGLPLGKEFCATMAIEALQEATQKGLS